MPDDAILVDAKLKAVVAAVNSLRSYNIVTQSAEESASFVKFWIPTQSVLLNLLLGEANFGFPIGKIFEIFGEFSHGKSTISQIMMAGVQAAGGVSVLADAEASWLEEHAIHFGHDPGRHIFIEADTTEAGFAGIKDVCKNFMTIFGGTTPLLFDWDTIAASPTEKEVEDETDRMAAKAQIIRSNLRVLSKLLPKVPASCIFVNQTIDQIGGQQKRKTTPGGSGIKFWATQRLKVTKVGSLKAPLDKTRDIGFIAEVTAVKNKLAPPYKKVDIPILYESGVDQMREVINYLLDHTSIVNTAGAYKQVKDFPEGGKYISFYEKDIPSLSEQFPTLYDFLVDRTKRHWLGVL